MIRVSRIVRAHCHFESIWRARGDKLKQTIEDRAFLQSVSCQTTISGWLRKHYVMAFEGNEDDVLGLCAYAYFTRRSDGLKARWRLQREPATTHAPARAKGE